MSDNTHIGDTVRLDKPKIVTDDLGRSVWSVGTQHCVVEFELEEPEVATDPYNTLRFEDY